MFKRRLFDDVPATTFFHWFLLAFLAGNVNTGGFMACSRFVTHVTGFATLFGIDAAKGRWNHALGILTVPGYFLIGVMISAYLIDRPAQRRQRPHYATVMLIVTICLALVALLGRWKVFGVFGTPLALKQDYLLLSLLCGASGLQNAAISTSSGSTVRTTHLTGITTDLGIGLVRAMSMDRRSSEFHSELRAASARLGTLISFGAGSAVGAVLFLKLDYLGFLLPALIAGYVTLVALRVDRKRRRPQ